jgi:RHS repeat-associated protein
MDRCTRRSFLRRAGQTAVALGAAAFAGDGKRRRIEDSDGLRNMVWDAENILAETDSGNATVAGYTCAPRLYGELVSQRRSGATSFHHYDALGSTDRLTDASQATLVSYLYRAFGQQTVVSGSSANRFTWVGRLGYYRQGDSDSYWLRAHTYQPGSGRFLSYDPRRDEPNRYHYVHNRPVLLADPSGLDARVPLRPAAAQVHCSALRARSGGAGLSPRAGATVRPVALEAASGARVTASAGVPPWPCSPALASACCPIGTDDVTRGSCGLCWPSQPLLFDGCSEVTMAEGATNCLGRFRIRQPWEQSHIEYSVIRAGRHIRYCKSANHFCLYQTPPGGRGSDPGGPSTPLDRCLPNVYAITYCCDDCGKCLGKTFYCRSEFMKYPPCVQNCYRRHEGTHVTQCNSDRYGYGAGKSDAEKQESEREAYCVQLVCLATIYPQAFQGRYTGDNAWPSECGPAPSGVLL